MDTRGQNVDRSCSEGDTLMDKRCQCGDSGCSAAKLLWIHVARMVTEAAVQALHLWIHVASALERLECCVTHMDTRGQLGDSGCSAAIHICIHVGSGVTEAAVRRFTYGYTWSVW